MFFEYNISIMATNELIQSFVTLKEMLVDRGINIDRLNSISDKELDMMSKVHKIFSLDVSDKLKIVYHINTKFKINELKKFMNEDEHIIIVFKEKINNLNIKNMREQNNIQIEIFMMKELQYNISKHVLVPKHEIVKNTDEIDNLLNTYKLRKNQLPIILHTDPMARYLNIKVGEIVKIIRSSPSAGEAIVYRYCV